MDKKKSWYEDRNKLIELAEFMVEAEEITTAKELLDYFKNPTKYTEVWKLYEEEIAGHEEKKSKLDKSYIKSDIKSNTKSNTKSDDKGIPLVALAALLPIIPP